MLLQRGESGLYLLTPGIQMARVMPATLDDISDDFEGDLSRWTQEIGTWTISSGVVQLDTSGANLHGLLRYTDSPFADDQWGKVTLTTFGDAWCALSFRGNATGNWYMVGRDSGNTAKWSVVNAAGEFQQTVQSASQTFSAGDVIGADCIGAGDSTVVRVWINPSGAYGSWGAADHTFTNNPTSPSDSGDVGLGGRFTSTKPQMDDFSGGDV